MKVMIVVLALVALAAAAPAEPEVVPIVRSEFNQEPEGGYNYGYETGNGITHTETGEVREALDEENKPHKVVVVRGSYSYKDNDGNIEAIEYYADETGFHPEGNSIPKPARR